MALLAKASGADPLGLMRLIHEDRRTFDSIWYSRFPPASATDIDALLRGEEG